MDRKILVLVVAVILAGAGAAAVQGYMKDKYLRLVPVEKHILLDSPKGLSLIGAAESMLVNEGIDTRYLLPRYIIESSSYNPSGSPILRFSGTETFYSAKIYTNHNLTNRETGAVFAADLRRYHIDNQSYGELWDYGKNHTLVAGNNTLEVMDSVSGKVKLKVLNYNVVQDENQTGALVNEINRKFEMARLDFRMNADEPVVIIDAPAHTGNLKNTGDLFVEVGFCGSSPCAVRMEEKSKESERSGWVEYNITHRIKYLNSIAQ